MERSSLKQLQPYHPPENIQKRIRDIISKNQHPTVKAIDESTLSHDFVLNFSSSKLLHTEKSKPHNSRNTRSLDISVLRDKIKMQSCSQSIYEGSDMDHWHRSPALTSLKDHQSNMYAISSGIEGNLIEGSQDRTSSMPRVSLEKLQSKGKKLLKVVLSNNSEDIQKFFSVNTPKTKVEIIKLPIFKKYNNAADNSLFNDQSRSYYDKSGYHMLRRPSKKLSIGRHL